MTLISTSTSMNGYHTLIGPPGIGKTQFCLKCCSQAILNERFSSRLANGVVYFDTELKFDANRLLEIVTLNSPHFQFTNTSSDDEINSMNSNTQLNVRVSSVIPSYPYFVMY